MKKHEIKAFIMAPAVFFFLLLLWSGGSRLMQVQPSRSALPDFTKADVELFFSQAQPGDTVTHGSLNKTSAEGRHSLFCPVSADSAGRIQNPRMLKDSNGNIISKGCYRNTVFRAFPPETGFV